MPRPATSLTDWPGLRPEELFASNRLRVRTRFQRRGAAPRSRGEPVLVAEGLVKHFPVRSKGLIRRRSGEIHAVCDVSLTLHAHQTLALVGESGCGKSTTARMLLNLVPPTRGRVSYRGQSSPDCPRPGCGRCVAACRSCSKTRSPPWTRG